MLVSAVLLFDILRKRYLGMGGDSIVQRIGGRISIFWRVCSTAAKSRSCLARAVADRQKSGRRIHRFVMAVSASLSHQNMEVFKECC